MHQNFKKSEKAFTYFGGLLEKAFTFSGGLLFAVYNVQVLEVEKPLAGNLCCEIF